MLDRGEVQALGGHVCCHKDILSPFTELSDCPLTLLLVYGVSVCVLGREGIIFEIYDELGLVTHSTYLVPRGCSRPPHPLATGTRGYRPPPPSSLRIPTPTLLVVVEMVNTGVPRLQIFFNERSWLHKTTHRGWGLLQTLQEVDHLCLLFHILHLLDHIQTGRPRSAHIHCHYGNRQTTRLSLHTVTSTLGKHGSSKSPYPEGATLSKLGIKIIRV